ncbi:hypothetical protein GCM10011316_06260 [Roseibium aquae]|uniref:DUF4169 family protein n=1 Tax=Roseibium aquae TaxID=1323746 RepID=A0A916WWV7_9HYPH|nr:DUF4169 family protein [Roseibium aquae]GGB36885.1 hypothetical protein GCM10011316_06260 [Roseibium aquae]
MNGEVVNLRQARKRKKREDKDRQAAENRRIFGQTKAEKAAARFEGEKRLRSLDGHRLSSCELTPSDGDDPGN